MTKRKKTTKPKKIAQKKSCTRVYTHDELTERVLNLYEFVNKINKSIDLTEDELLSVSRDFEARLEKLEDRVAKLGTVGEADEPEDDEEDDDPPEKEEYEVVIKLSKTLRYNVKAIDADAAIAAANKYYDPEAYNPYDDDDASVEMFMSESDEIVEDSWVER